MRFLVRCHSKSDFFKIHIFLKLLGVKLSSLLEPTVFIIKLKWVKFWSYILLYIFVIIVIEKFMFYKDIFKTDLIEFYDIIWTSPSCYLQ